ncbi:MULTISPECIES: RES domain-containing protein [unclassified Mesorhizobium]|uniref:RES family NAD+ phosphorylase n=1 Tax=unclassified Mesorhizobium TaxID=325217 RepID=UPI000FD4614E|nr:MULTISPECIES: RES domain-containing protein [unclassified Mesorhizobium]RVB78248.1 RES domain-containing protein [Mesorhizobium sp. M6A.T.Cr.TU.014.01.1.1]RWP78842.1 MAG: RES domain-containing protein [Mesorhizobium sp.]RWQ06985.1 MAG: RES domain-containing protein [Mesorhizobium sp.]RWQ09458.1 MAG: RES domain-containing protein [Mesorhizobium sp.]
MTPLPAALGGSDLVGWRLDHAAFAPTWDSGEGAYRVGGRWNSRGVRAVYCSIDPSTAILEVAVHKGFRALDTIAHVMTAAIISDVTEVHIVNPGAVPNPNWLRPGIPSSGQQAFGDDLLQRHRFVVIPSAVSQNGWNLIFDASVAKGAYAMKIQEAFALDTRLHPPPAK